MQILYSRKNVLVTNDLAFCGHFGDEKKFYNIDTCSEFYKHFTQVTYDRSKISWYTLKTLLAWDHEHIDWMVLLIWLHL